MFSEYIRQPHLFCGADKEYLMRLPCDRAQGNRIKNIFSGCLPSVRNFVQNFAYFSGKWVNASGRVDKNRRKIEVVKPFELRSGSTLVEQPQFFCGGRKKTA